MDETAKDADQQPGQEAETYERQDHGLPRQTFEHGPQRTDAKRRAHRSDEKRPHVNKHASPANDDYAARESNQPHEKDDTEPGISHDRVGNFFSQDRVKRT